MNPNHYPGHYPGIRLKQLLTEAGLLEQFDAAVHARNYPKMKALIQQVASGREEAQRFVGVVFASPQHYDKVVSDLHYNGKTVSERLAIEGLLDPFKEAVEAKAAAQIIDLLERAAITRPWATQLAVAILAGPAQPPIPLALGDHRNAGLSHARNELAYPSCIRPVECPRDPYMHLGCHPQSVERVWDQLGSALPLDCRCIVFGTPGLVAPRSGVLLGKAFGTQYLVRIPLAAVDEAVRNGAPAKFTWSNGQITDLKQEYGDDWIFGRYLKQETDWVSAVYQAVESSEQ